MNKEERNTERQRVLEMIEIEERLGPVVSGGPVRGAIAETRRAAEGKASPSTALRARGRVRFLAHAIPTPQNRAA